MNLDRPIAQTQKRMAWYALRINQLFVQIESLSSRMRAQKRLLHQLMKEKRKLNEQRTR